MRFAFGDRLLRRLLLWLAKRMPHERMLERSRNGASRAVRSAAASSEAYRQLLREAGVPAASRGLGDDWSSLPVLTKDNTFGRFPLTSLARDVPPGDLADVLTSSGRGGRIFGFRLTSRKQHERAAFDIDLGLQDAFGVDNRTTLLVNCLPMGVVFRSNAVTVANVSVREDMACAILRDLGPRFEQTLVCTDPLFVRRLLAQAEAMQLDWCALRTSLIIGEEMLVESQRDYLADKLGIDLERDPLRTIASSFGVGELGLNLLFESRETITIRRAMRRNPAVEHLMAGHPLGASMPSVFCYNPMRCFIEVLAPDAHGYGELCFTVNDADAVIPLPRYTTGDFGRLVARSDVCSAAELAGTGPPWLPVALVCGRSIDRKSGLPTAEEVKEVIYAETEVADRLSGAFRLSSIDGLGHLTLQATSAEAAAEPALAERIADLVDSSLSKRLHVVVLDPQAFPWRPSLDFERKFAYTLA